MTTKIPQHRNECGVCRSDDVRHVLTLKEMPVSVNTLCRSREEALNVPRGDIELVQCTQCGFIFNRAFDPDKITYTENYENSLFHSELFRQFAEELVERLISTYHLHRATIVEIGCGSGDFLNLLCERSQSTGYGFDKSYTPGKSLIPIPTGVTFITDYYDMRYADVKPDLIVCRHVLEHIHDPVRYLQSICQTPGNGETLLYVEVPNASYMIDSGSFCDIIYEHYGYYTASSISRLFRLADMTVQAVHPSFGNQFLLLEAIYPTKSSGSIADESTGPILAPQSFSDRFHHFIETWEQRLAAYNAENKTVILWGAGSKGITFLNMIPNSHYIKAVVDINPVKTDCLTSGTNHLIVGLKNLKDLQPDVIITMNPNYTDEIQAQLHELELDGEILSAL